MRFLLWDPMIFFNPDTYIRHELDGIPIYDSSRYIYNNREVYHNK